MKMWMMVLAVVGVMGFVQEADALPDFDEPAGSYVDMTYYYTNGTSSKETNAKYGVMPYNLVVAGELGSSPYISVSDYGSEFGGNVGGDSDLGKVTATAMFWDTFWVSGDFDTIQGGVGTMIEGGIGVDTSGEWSKGSFTIFGAAMDPENPMPPESGSLLYASREMKKEDGVPVITTDEHSIGDAGFTPGTNPNFAEHDFGGFGYDFEIEPNKPFTLLWGSLYSMETDGGMVDMHFDYRHHPIPSFILEGDGARYYDNVYAYSRGDQMPGGDPVPEPATITLFGLGLLGVVGAARKKKK